MEARNMISAPAGLAGGGRTDSALTAIDSAGARTGGEGAPADEDTTEFDEGGAHGL
jgi:hypothetical protein